MLTLKNLSKSFNTQILKNISYRFPDNGLVSIVGPSGCGKSTLLNIISGLDNDYQGEVLINNTNLKTLSEKSKSDFRLKNIGYIFQDFKLFNLLDVESNVMFTLEAISSDSKSLKKKMCSDVLKLCGIEHKKKQIVNKLSGGEKQRVSISRAIITSPKILLCDEPTGNLDEKNSINIFKILKSISDKCLVIVVTHDHELASKFSNQILFLKDGLLNASILENQTNENLIKMENTFSKKNPKFSLDFLFKNAISKMKAKKFRTSLITISSVLSIIGIGLSMILSTTISNAVTDSFSKIIDKNQIVINKKTNNPNSFNYFYSASLEDVERISDKYKKCVDNIGITYLTNFEDFFKERNEVYTASTDLKFYLKSLNIRSVNDYSWLSDVDIKTIYPQKPSSMDDNEVILGLSFKDMSNLCFDLQIERNFKSLGNYIKTHDFVIGIGTQNDSWGYSNDEFFKIVAVVETSFSQFIHENPRWNQYVLETSMRLPTSDDIEATTLAPYTLKKVFNIHFLDEVTNFLDEIIYDYEFQNFIFERMSDSYSQSYQKYKDTMDKTILVFVIDKNGIDLSDVNIMTKITDEIEGYTIFSSGGYETYSSSLVLGFSNNVFFSCSEDKLSEAIDAYTVVNVDSRETINLPQGVAEGNILRADKGVTISTRLPLDDKGEKYSLEKNEILISSGLFNEIKRGEKIKEEESLYFAANKQFNGNNYIYGSLNIKGVVNNSKKIIYQNPIFSISFFRDNIGISSFNLIPKTIILNIKEGKDIEKIINKLNKNFSKYQFSNPLLEIGKSVTNTMNYVTKTILIFSIIAIIISTFLLIIVSYLNIVESKGDINLLRHLGFQDSRIISTFVSSSFVNALLSTFASAVSLIAIEIFLTFFLKSLLNTELTFKINLYPIIICTIISLLLPLIFSIIISSVIIMKNKKKKR